MQPEGNHLPCYAALPDTGARCLNEALRRLAERTTAARGLEPSLRGAA